MRQFPQALKKSRLPSFAAYPVGYDVIRAHLESHLPAEEFHFGFFDIDAQLKLDRNFNPIVVFRLDYNPGKWREAHWHLYAYGALRSDKSAIKNAMLNQGFGALSEFLRQSRSGIWKDLAFSRSLHWNSASQELRSEDVNQLDIKR